MGSLYVYANVKLKYGQLVAFNDTMATVRRVMEQHGWKLVGAWSTVVGDLHEVHDMWEVESADAIPAAFAAAYEDPEFVRAARDLTMQVEREVLTLVTKTPYSP
jgi:NIPSNAP